MTPPAFNAFLNGASACLLSAGFLFVRRKNIAAHRVCMSAAVLTSALFLVSYLRYHAQSGSVRFPGAGWIRTLYLAILSSHTVLAAAIVPLILITFYRAARGRYDRHARIARWTWPVWMYVSMTGILIYWMLYRM
ncbi:MAG: DUF420 domain-containing protein [Elusimicrobia bacterium]|nr:DUF420 domain-containing protein [Elusimicrobiota bacterium]